MPWSGVRVGLGGGSKGEGGGVGGRERAGLIRSNHINQEESQGERGGCRGGVEGEESSCICRVFSKSNFGMFTTGESEEYLHVAPGWVEVMGYVCVGGGEHGIHVLLPTKNLLLLLLLLHGSGLA